MTRTVYTIKPLHEVAKDYIPSKDVFPIGYEEFDRAMDGGLREGELITVSGSTGEGKTSICQHFTINFHKQSVPTLWFTYEQDPYYLGENFKRLDMKLPELLVYTPVELASGQLDFIEESIKEGVEEKAIKVVIIDHLHYLVPLKASINTSLLIGSIVRELKKIAVKHKVIIFLIAHTRKINVGEELNLSSIRDSQLVVCESDYVFLIERKRKKKTAREKLASDFISTGDELLNQSRVSLAKNRRTGKILYLDFNVQDGKFLPITNIYEEEGKPIQAYEPKSRNQPFSDF